MDTFAVGVHEAYHSFEATQSPERVAQLQSELEATDPEFLGRVREWWESVSPLNAASEATAQEETRATTAQFVAPLVAYLDTPRGASDFAQVYEQNPGRLRGTLEAVWDFLADLTRILPNTSRTQARRRLEAARGNLPESSVQILSLIHI